MRGMNDLLQLGPRYRLHKCALGAASKRIRMDVLPDNPFGSRALKLHHRPKDAKTVHIELRTIDECIAAENLPIPNVIKMDTQGCKLTILQGAQKTLPKVDLLMCETWLTRTYGPETPLLIELADWLRDAGFYFWDFTEVYRDEGGTLISQDSIFLNARHKLSHLDNELKTHRGPALVDGADRVSASNKPWRERLRRVFQ